jgi:hypothetical protein
VADRAPSGPPLLQGSSGVTAESAEATVARSPAGEVDPLVSNGLGSPSCRSGELLGVARRNCETSGFIGAAAPTGNYGIDVHIDTGVLGLSSGGLLSTVQDLAVTPVWMALVWIVHSLVVLLEWCFALNLLAGAGTLTGSLVAGERFLTGPWLPLGLSIAAVLLAYEGLVRRRIAESLGQALVVLLMIGGGLWVMLNPAGTVGALSDWADEAGLGTLAVAAQGSPLAPGKALSADMEDVFAATIEGPWCFLEFGNVRWCREPAMLDGQLKQAGLKIAQEETAQSSASSSGPVQRSARLLREARTNGALFLALPTNGPARNSINSQTSLLHWLCNSDEATNCSGPTAAQAEFRTNSGTWSRVGGLLLISIGVLGMVLLLGHIGLRLLMAAMLSLLYLLLAPGVALAPVLGERGRALFRGWSARLFGAVLSKLVFAFLLGVVLAAMGVIESLNGLGWWTQWLLLAAFWWGVYLRRNQLLGGASGIIPAGEHRYRRNVGSRVARAVERPLRERVRARVEHLRGRPAPAVEHSIRSPRTPTPRALPDDPQALRLLAHDRARGRTEGGPAEAGGEDRRAQLGRIARAREQAIDAGDERRAGTLARRAGRVEAELRGVTHRDADEQPAGSGVGSGASRTIAEHAGFLDAQARLPARGARDRRGERRDYSALAPLAALTRKQYEQLGPGDQRAARLQIDRELAARREGRVEDRQAAVRAPSARTAAGDGSSPGVPHAGVVRPTRRPPEPESEEWRDMREVAAGRKRQLGIGRP